MNRFSHFNFNVIDLDKSLSFYKEALNMHEIRRKESPDNSYIIVYMGYDDSDFQLELTYLKDWNKEYYDLGDDEFHLGIDTDDYDTLHKLHEEMGIICLENPKMGLYFIEDPDGYWIEIRPFKKR